MSCGLPLSAGLTDVCADELPILKRDGAEPVWGAHQIIKSLRAQVLGALFHTCAFCAYLRRRSQVHDTDAHLTPRERAESTALIRMIEYPLYTAKARLRASRAAPLRPLRQSFPTRRFRIGGSTRQTTTRKATLSSSRFSAARHTLRLLHTDCSGSSVMRRFEVPPPHLHQD